MPAITQLISPYTGGVSSQPDELKRNGQVTQLTNGLTDPTYGLMKRPGLQYFSVLDNIDAGTDLTNAYWFFINRDADEAYFGAITEGNVQIWNGLPDVSGNFIKATVTYSDDGGAFDLYADVTGVKTSNREPNYDVLTVQDRTYIVNRNFIVEERANTPYVLGARATVRLMQIDDMQAYTVTINGVDCTWAGTTEYPDAADGQPATSAEVVLTAVKKAIDDADTGVTNLVVTQLATSLEITADETFTIDTDAGQDGQALEVFQDEIGNVSKLPSTSVEGRTVKIINTVDEKDSYFVQFYANDGVSGTGIWKESRGWDTDKDSGLTEMINPGLDPVTMPFELYNSAKNEFIVRPIDWTDRLVGNKTSNSAPSFVGNAISKVFIYGNRFGILSEDNVIMSQTGEFDNFYFTTAQTITNSDPIDISCSSLKPARLHSVVTEKEGLVLFSDSEQFVLFSEDGNLTPSDSIIRSISNFQNSTVTEPEKIGSNIYFLNRGRNEMNCYGMATRGETRVASTVDIGKVASGYISPEIDYFRTDPQNSMLIMSSRVSNDVFLYRYFNNGQQDVMQSWFKWTMPGKVQTFAFTNSLYFFICKAENEYVLCGANIGRTPTLENHPSADYYTPVKGTITFDATTKKSQIPIPYQNQTSLNPVAIFGPPKTFGGAKNTYTLTDMYFLTDNKEDGYLLDVTRDADGNWYVPGDYSGQEQNITVAWECALDIELPKTYFRNQQTQAADYTASLVISRYKFSCGTSGAVEFFTRQLGSPDWINVQPVTFADYYRADNIPIVDEVIFTLPLYQRNTNFVTRIVASSPFPFTLNSMMWEGQYSPRFYRRA